MYAEFMEGSYALSQAADGIAAWEFLRHTRPDIVITDLALPRMDGFELIAKIRADERLRDVPVIALSGYSSAEQEKRVRALGISELLLKPCFPDTLIAAIEKHMRRLDK